MDPECRGDSAPALEGLMGQLTDVLQTSEWVLLIIINDFIYFL